MGEGSAEDQRRPVHPRRHAGDDARIIRKFLKALYSHKDGDKAEWLDAFGVAREALRGELLLAIYVLVKAYWVGHNVVKPIPTFPSVIPAR